MTVSRRNKPHLAYVCVAGAVFLAASAYAIFWMLLSGVFDGGGLWGVGPKLLDYIPLVGLGLGGYLFVRGASGKLNGWFMLLASAVVVVSVYVSGITSLFYL